MEPMRRKNYIIVPFIQLSQIVNNFLDTNE